MLPSDVKLTSPTQHRYYKSTEPAEKADKRFQKVLEAWKNGPLARKAATIACMPKPTFHRRSMKANETMKNLSVHHKKRALIDVEENIIYEVLFRSANLGKEYTREDICDAIETYCETLPQSLQAQLPFKNLAPRKDFKSDFTRRHNESGRMGRSAKEDEVRWTACNSNTLTTQTIRFQKLCTNTNVEQSWIYNLDETCVTTNRDTSSCPSKLRFIRYGNFPTSQLRVAQFSYVNRVTMMATMCADGSTFALLFSIRGSNIPYGMIDNDNRWDQETFSFVFRLDLSMLSVIKNPQ